MKIFSVKFKGVYPVGSHCIICAEDITRALALAKKQISHTQINFVDVTEIDISKEKVISYASGDY